MRLLAFNITKGNIFLDKNLDWEGHIFKFLNDIHVHPEAI